MGMPLVVYKQLFNPSLTLVEIRAVPTCFFVCMYIYIYIYEQPLLHDCGHLGVPPKAARTDLAQPKWDLKVQRLMGPFQFHLGNRVGFTNSVLLNRVVPYNGNGIHLNPFEQPKGSHLGNSCMRRGVKIAAPQKMDPILPPLSFICPSLAEECLRRDHPASEEEPPFRRRWLKRREEEKEETTASWRPGVGRIRTRGGGGLGVEAWEGLGGLEV